MFGSIGMDCVIGKLYRKIIFQGIIGHLMIIFLYSRLLLTQPCITQYYHLSRPDGPVAVFSPRYIIAIIQRLSRK